MVTDVDVVGYVPSSLSGDEQRQAEQQLGAECTAADLTMILTHDPDTAWRMLRSGEVQEIKVVDAAHLADLPMLSVIRPKRRGTGAAVWAILAGGGVTAWGWSREHRWTLAAAAVAALAGGGAVTLPLVTPDSAVPDRAERPPIAAGVPPAGPPQVPPPDGVPDAPPTIPSGSASAAPSVTPSAEPTSSLPATVEPTPPPTPSQDTVSGVPVGQLPPSGPLPTSPPATGSPAEPTRAPPVPSPDASPPPPEGEPVTGPVCVDLVVPELVEGDLCVL